MGAIQSRDLSLPNEYCPVSDHDVCAIAKLRSWKGNIVEHLLLVPFAPSCEANDPLLSLLYNFVLSDPFYPCFDVTCTQPACDRFPNVQTFHTHLRNMNKDGAEPGPKRVARSWILLRLQDNQIDPNATHLKYGFVKSLVNVPGCKLAVGGYYHSLSCVTLPATQGQNPVNKVNVSFCLARNFCNEARSAAMFHLVAFSERATSKSLTAPGNPPSSGGSAGQTNFVPTSLTFCFRKGNLPALRLFAKLFQWHLTINGQASAQLGSDFTITPVPDSADCLSLTLSDSVLGQVMHKVQLVARKSTNGAIALPSFIQAPHGQVMAQQAQSGENSPNAPGSPKNGKRGNKQQQNVDQLAGSVPTPFDEMIQAEKNTWCAEEEETNGGKKKASSASPDDAQMSVDHGYQMMMMGTLGTDSPQAFGMGCPSEDGFSALASSGNLTAGASYGAGPSGSPRGASNRQHISVSQAGMAGAAASGSMTGALMSPDTNFDGLHSGAGSVHNMDSEVNSNAGDPPTHSQSPVKPWAPDRASHNNSHNNSHRASQSNSAYNSFRQSPSRPNAPSYPMSPTQDHNNQQNYSSNNNSINGQQFVNQQQHQGGAPQPPSFVQQPHQQHINGNQHFHSQHMEQQQQQQQQQQQWPNQSGSFFPHNGLIMPDATPVHASSPNGAWIPCWWSDPNMNKLYLQRCNYQPHLNEGKVLLEVSPESQRHRHPQDPLPLMDAQGARVAIPVAFSQSGAQQAHNPVIAVPAGTMVQGANGMMNL